MNTGTPILAALSSSARLTADIDTTAIAWDIPIGPAGAAASYYYRGTFDGNGKTITINGSFSLFRAIGTGSVIKNLTIAGSISSADQNLASVAREMVNGGEVNNVTNNASITNTYTTSSQGYVGGIVPNVMSGKVLNCTNNGSVTTTNPNANRIGGIVGYANGAATEIRGNVNTGVISAANNGPYIAAVIGDAQNVPVANITDNSYLFGTANKGGNVTISYASVDANIKAFLPTGVTAAIGKTANPAKTNYRYNDLYDPTGLTVVILRDDDTVETVSLDKFTWDKTDPLELEDTEVTITVTPGGGFEPMVYTYAITVSKVSRLTTSGTLAKKIYKVGESFDPAGLTVQATFGTVYPSDVLTPDDYTVYPETFSAGNTGVDIVYSKDGVTVSCKVLGLMIDTTPGTPVLNDNDTEADATDDYYELATATDLQWFSIHTQETPTLKAKLMNNIDATSIAWIPIGAGAVGLNQTFQGEFDGDNHTITLDCDGQAAVTDTSDFSGLFYQTGSGAYIHDLTVDGKVSASAQYLGGVVSYMTAGGKLENVTNKATVFCGAGSNQYTGGVVGYVNGAVELINVKNQGTVSNASGNGTTVRTGGVVGGIGTGNPSATLTNCSNEGSVTGYGAANGGVVGEAGRGTLNDCENSGSVSYVSGSGTLNGIGGILGYSSATNATYVIIKDCINTGQISSAQTSVNIGSVIGNTNLSVANVPSGLNNITGNSYLVGTAEVGLGGRYLGVATATNARAILPEGVGAVVMKAGNPTKLTGYFEQSTFDITGFKAVVVLYDGTETEVTADKITWDKIDPLTASDTQVTITVTPGGSLAPVSFTYTISVVYLTNLTVSGTYKKSYVDGEAFDPTGMTLRLQYSNTTTDVLPDDNYTVTPAILSAGDTSVVVRYVYNGKTVAATITGITVSGTPAEPSLVDGFYQITTANDLMWFARKVNASTSADDYADTRINAKLTTDVDVSDKAWVPIGSTYFQGIFDGNGHAITVDIDSVTNTALFNRLNDATVKDLTLEGRIKAASPSAGFAYWASGATVLENLTNKASIEARGGSSAGIVTRYDNGADGYIKNCRNEGTIGAPGSPYAANSATAGIVANVDAASIEISRCVNTGTIIGTATSGGIVGIVRNGIQGRNPSADVRIVNNTNTGTITGSFSPLLGQAGIAIDDLLAYPAIGGIVGNAICPGATISGNDNSGTVSNLAAVPDALERYDYVGDVVGFAATEENLTNNTTAAGVVLGSSKDYESGKGTKDDPFIIKTPLQLDQMRMHKPAFYKQGANIDLTDYIKDSAVGWVPTTPSEGVGGIDALPTSVSSFYGGLDGAGYEITGLWVDIPTAGASDVPAVGLFGTCSGELKNINLVLDAKGITARSLAGGLVGSLGTGGSVDNCTVSGDGAINGFSASGGARLGGIVGLGDTGTSITNSTNYVDVIGSGNFSISVGGIVGLFNGDLIDNCVNYGNIVGDAAVGGIAGMFGDGTISNSTNNGTVTGNYNGNANNVSGNAGGAGYGVGGIAGNTSNGGTISGSTNNGQVTGTDSVAGVGSIIGSPGNGAQLSDNQYLEGTGNAVGGWTYTATDDQARTYVPEPNDPGTPNNPTNPVTPTTPSTPSSSTNNNTLPPSSYALLSDAITTASTAATTTPRPETKPETTPAVDAPRENTPDTTPAPLIGSEVVPTKQAQTFIEYVIDNPLLIPVGILALALIVGGAAFAYVRFKRNTEDSTTKHGS